MKNRILASALALVLVTGMAVSASAIGSVDVSIAKVYNMPVIDGKYDPAEGWGEPVGVIDASNINDYLSDIVTGIILFFILGSEFFINYKLIFRGSVKGGDKHAE